MKIGQRSFDDDHTYVMGILNMTPDSFSDGGRYNELDIALKRVGRMLDEGADIIDIGGESTRPGAEVVPADVEISRVVPVIEAIRKNFDVPISLDTYKGEVALEGIKAGADMINDVCGLEYDDKMADVVAGADVAYCLCYQREKVYKDILSEMVRDIEESLEKAMSKGISAERICIDPGIGFNKTYEENLLILKRIDVLHTFGVPVLLGTSRKSFIGKALDVPVNERMAGTLATTVSAVLNGVRFVRVHDIKENVQAIKLIEEIRNVKG
ncbi:MAG TPA: dihydropteroate synthase [Lachnospiraceae bacterium]|nr:dihydropteroate synthase [Lachnospiraceae bacterium]